MTTFYHWENDNLILKVHIQPRSSQTAIKGVLGDRLKIKITSAPVDGQANADIIKFLAKTFAVAKSQVIIQSGLHSRKKSLCIQSPKKLPDYINDLR
jgi:uncharacterized protein (TIGR00251 family)